MADLTCAEVEESATEYALGILPAGEAGAVSDHLAGCPACRLEVDRIRSVGDRLLELVPDAEPPLGFDRRALTAMAPRRPRWRPSRATAIIGGAAAAAAVAAALTLAALGGGGGNGHPHTADLTGVLRQGNRTVGSVYLGGNPAWVTMTVQDTTVTGTVTCQLISRDGTATSVGDFQIVDGTGTWSAPDPASASKPVAARLIAPDGTVLAAATFRAG